MPGPHRRSRGASAAVSTGPVAPAAGSRGAGLGGRSGIRRRTARNAKPGARADRSHRLRSEETRLNSSHPSISYAVFCLKKKKKNRNTKQQESEEHEE